MSMSRLGLRGVVLGASIALLFGIGSGILFARWSSEAVAGSPVGPSVPVVVPSSASLSPSPAVRASRTKPRALASPARPRRSCGRAGARVVRFRVEVERGLPVTTERFAGDLLSILCDERSWIGSGRVRFRYDPDARTLISLLGARATERRCLGLVGLSVRYTYSCASAGARRAVLNADRWFDGLAFWPGTVRDYRRLMVNHEVGHLLGQRHRGCPRPGARAPVMMQQGKDLGGCRSSPWPRRYELRSLP